MWGDTATPTACGASTALSLGVHRSSEEMSTFSSLAEDFPVFGSGRFQLLGESLAAHLLDGATGV
eukprot:2546551-Amphidinium_carterae.1